MKDYIEQRVLEIAAYLAGSGATVREAARKFHVSKSTVHKDMMERLPLLHSELARKVRGVLDVNKAERHLRGGEATCRKYSRKNSDTNKGILSNSEKRILSICLKGGKGVRAPKHTGRKVAESR